MYIHIHTHVYVRSICICISPGCWGSSCREPPEVEDEEEAGSSALELRKAEDLTRPLGSKSRVRGAQSP